MKMKASEFTTANLGAIVLSALKKKKDFKRRGGKCIL